MGINELRTGHETSRAAALIEFVYRSAIDMAARRFTTPDDDWLPMMFFHTPSGVMNIIAIPMIDGRKDDTASAIRSMLAMNKATDAVLLTSAWMVARPAGTPGVADLRPSEQPDRREVLVLTGVDDATAITRVAAIHRHADRPPTLGALDDPAEGPGIAGRFIDALRLGIG
jgi:hypothetical protein